MLGQATLDAHVPGPEALTVAEATAPGAPPLDVLLAGPRDVLDYLLERGHLDAGAVVLDDLVVRDVSRRNRNYRVERARGRSFLVKQGVGEGGRAAIANEARVYELLASSENAVLTEHLPAVRGYDAARGILVLDLLTGRRDVGEHLARGGALTEPLGASLGQALGRLRRLADLHLPPGLLAALPAAPPFALVLHRPTLDGLGYMSSANHELLRVIQEFDDLSGPLDRQLRDWHAAAFVHKDLKWENCLLAEDASDPSASLAIVDWELAGGGDPSWDVGCVLGASLGTWLSSLPLSAGAPPERMLPLAGRPLTGLRPGLRALWASYCAEADLAPVERPVALRAAVEAAGARLVQTAFEHMQGATRLTGAALCLLQLALNVLRRPSEAAVQLLGLSPAGAA